MRVGGDRDRRQGSGGDPAHPAGAQAGLGRDQGGPQSPHLTREMGQRQGRCGGSLKCRGSPRVVRKVSLKEKQNVMAVSVKGPFGMGDLEPIRPLTFSESEGSRAGRCRVGRGGSHRGTDAFPDGSVGSMGIRGTGLKGRQERLETDHGN